MVNQQLVEYIKQQFQGGVSRDAVKKALTDAGWPEGDVNDSLDAGSPSASPTATATVSAPATAASSSFPKTLTINPVTAMGGNVIAPISSRTASGKERYFDETRTETEEKGGHGSRIAMIVMGAVILALLAALGYIYYSLSGKLTALSGAGNNSTSELQNAQAQISQLTADRDKLSMDNTKFMSDNQALLSEVAVYGGAADSEITLQGVLAKSGTGYTIKTAHGITVTVKNYKDARVSDKLKDLVGQTVDLTGTHKLADLTVTAINGTPIAAPAAEATSTATSSNP